MLLTGKLKLVKTLRYSQPLLLLAEEHDLISPLCESSR